MTDYTDRRFVYKSSRRRRPPVPVNFMAVNDSNRRNRRRTYREHFNALWDKRTRNEDCPLFHFLVTLGTLIDRRVGEQCFGKQAGRDENRSA